jgi:hypothetical protein
LSIFISFTQVTQVARLLRISLSSAVNKPIMAALTQPSDLAVIDEEDDVPFDFDTIVDPVCLKRIRTGGKSFQTKARNTLMQASSR